MLCTLELFHTCNGNRWASHTLDLGAHGVQEFCQVRNFRLTRGAFDERPSRCQYRGHQQVCSSQHGGASTASEKDFGSLESLGGSANVTGCCFYLGSQCLHAFKVQVDRPGANNTPPG